MANSRCHNSDRKSEILQHRGFRTWALACLSVLLVLTCSGVAYADLAQEIQNAVESTLNGLVGDELAMPYFTFTFLGVNMRVNILGFAFCDPDPDPWVEPQAIPVPPYNIYGCQNVSTADVQVTPGETSAEIVLTIDRIFLDLETVRDRTILCALWGDPYPYSGTLIADGYMLAHASIGATFDLEHVGGCVRASLAPGSASFTLTPDEVGTHDPCLAANVDDYLLSELAPAMQDQMDASFQLILGNVMQAISDAICQATPVVDSSWGFIKSVYR